MTEFVRSIQKRIEDVLILDVEALCDFADNLQYHIPDSLSESKLHATHGSILKESANGLVVGEASCRREQIVLHGRDGSHGNLRGEVAHLVLSHPEVPLTFLKDDFQRPAPGVDPVSLEEVQLAVSGDESVPLSPLAALTEKQADIATGKSHVHSNVPASQTTAVLAPLLGMVEKGDELVGGVLLAFIYVLRLAHLDHTKIVASGVTGSDEQDDLRTGKPTVGQHVVKVNLTLDYATYHLNHQCNLAVVISITNHETGKQHQQSEHLQLRQLAVTLALAAEKPFFGQPENLCHVHYRIHCTRGIIFFEKLADL